MPACIGEVPPRVVTIKRRHWKQIQADQEEVGVDTGVEQIAEEPVLRPAEAAYEPPADHKHQGLSEDPAPRNDRTIKRCFGTLISALSAERVHVGAERLEPSSSDQRGMPELMNDDQTEKTEPIAGSELEARKEHGAERSRPMGAHRNTSDGEERQVSGVEHHVFMGHRGLGWQADCRVAPFAPTAI